MQSFNGCSRVEITNADSTFHGRVGVVMKVTRDKLAYIDIDGKRNYRLKGNTMELFPAGDPRRVRVLLDPSECTRINYFTGAIVPTQ